LRDGVRRRGGQEAAMSEQDRGTGNPRQDPGRPALPGKNAGPRLRKRGGEQPMVPPAEFTSYYGKPVINAPVWDPLDIAGYLFLGGLAGASSVLAAGAQLTARPGLERTAKAGAAGAAALALVALVHDLGRPARFANMLRVFKVTSPMSIGSWLLAGYVPAAGAAAAAALTRRAPRSGTVASATAALLGPAVAAYTGALIADTAVPAWHDGFAELPFVFIGSAGTAAGGLGLLGAPVSENAPARNLALIAVVLETAAFERMIRRLGSLVAEPYRSGAAGRYLHTARALSVVGALGALLGSHSKPLAAASGAALIGASAATRFGIFHAGLASAADPRYTVIPQRQRLATAQRRDEG
jgi:hypothetical protein